MSIRSIPLYCPIRAHVVSCALVYGVLRRLGVAWNYRQLDLQSWPCQSQYLGPGGANENSPGQAKRSLGGKPHKIAEAP